MVDCGGDFGASERAYSHTIDNTLNKFKKLNKSKGRGTEDLDNFLNEHVCLSNKSKKSQKKSQRSGTPFQKKSIKLYLMT